MRHHNRMLSVGLSVVVIGVGAVLLAALVGGVTGAQSQPAQPKPPKIDGKIEKGEYQFCYEAKEGKFAMDFCWTIDEEFIYGGMKAAAKGWLAVAFQPRDVKKEKMRGADQVMGFVKDGKLSIADMYANELVMHEDDTKLEGKESKLKGVNNIAEAAGTEDASGTTIEFKRKLYTADEFDLPIPVRAMIFLAYANADDFTTNHGPDGRLAKEINLITGKVEK